MIVGLNQNIEVLGRQFHVQTEVIEGGLATCRTTVFADGAVIGNRETILSNEIVDEKEIRRLMQEQHTQIVENLVIRLEEMAETEESGDQKANPPKPLRDSKPLPKKVVPRPSIDGIPGLRSSVRVRALFAAFRNDIDLEPPATSDDLVNCIESALVNTRRILTSPFFSDIRLDEQVRFFDLEERISAWLMLDYDHEKGVQVWCDVVVFSSYLGRINNRKELIEFDRKLLLWAFSEIGVEGMSEDVVDALMNLYGRDLRCDRMLNFPDEAGKSRWLAMLVELLDTL